jgi:hypothetical protein
MTADAFDPGGLVAADGHLERPVQQAEWLRPALVRVDDEQLTWTLGGDPVRPAVGLLTSFAELVDAPPEKIGRYARRWGILELCEHGMPVTHSRLAFGMGSEEEGRKPDGCGLLASETAGEFTESLELWRLYARQARSMLNLANALYEGRPGSEEDWRSVLDTRAAAVGMSSSGELDLGKLFAIRAHPSSRRFVLGNRVGWWLELGAVRVALQWPAEGVRIELIGSGLFGALAVQLAMAVSRTDGLGICSGCSQWYVKSRRPASGHRRFCEDCRTRGVPEMLAQRDRRARLRAARCDNNPDNNPRGNRRTQRTNRRDDPAS